MAGALSSQTILEEVRRRVAALCAPRPTEAQCGLLLAILGALLPPTVVVSHAQALGVVRRLVAVAIRLPSSPAEFGTLDRNDLMRIAGPNPRTLGILDTARRQPCFDRDGRYASHWCVVPRHLLEAEPDLLCFPHSLASALHRYVVDPQERRHWTAFALAVYRARCLYQPSQREERRTARAVAEDVALMVRTLCDRAPAQSLRELLPLADDDHRRGGSPVLLRRSHLVRLLALVQGRLHRLNRRGHAAVTMRAMHFVNGAIRRGLFEPAVHCSVRIRLPELAATLRELERTDPDRWWAATTSGATTGGGVPNRPGTGRRSPP